MWQMNGETIPPLSTPLASSVGATYQDGPGTAARHTPLQSHSLQPTTIEIAYLLPAVSAAVAAAACPADAARLLLLIILTLPVADP